MKLPYKKRMVFLIILQFLEFLLGFSTFGKIFRTGLLKLDLCCSKTNNTHVMTLGFIINTFKKTGHKFTGFYFFHVLKLLSRSIFKSTCMRNFPIFTLKFGPEDHWNSVLFTKAHQNLAVLYNGRILLSRCNEIANILIKF